jgi:hypothetical protein
LVSRKPSTWPWPVTPFILTRLIFQALSDWLWPEMEGYDCNCLGRSDFTFNITSRYQYSCTFNQIGVLIFKNVFTGLRGAVGLCLSLQVYREQELCIIGTENKSDILGPKVG